MVCRHGVIGPFHPLLPRRPFGRSQESQKQKNGINGFQARAAIAHKKNNRNPTFPRHAGSHERPRPPLRRCFSCGHNEIIEAAPRLINREYSNGAGLDAPPLALTYLGGINANPVGALWTYTCRQCGLSQWVVAKPAEVPIGPAHGTRLIGGGGPPAGPFR